MLWDLGEIRFGKQGEEVSEGRRAKSLVNEDATQLPGHQTFLYRILCFCTDPAVSRCGEGEETALLL